MLWLCELNTQLWYELTALRYIRGVFKKFPHFYIFVGNGEGGRSSTVEPRSIVPATIVFPHVLFAIFGPE